MALTIVMRLKQVILTLLLTASLMLVGCQPVNSVTAPTSGAQTNQVQTTGTQTTEAKPDSPAAAYSQALFAGGCFWCMEKPFDELPGVVATTSGYTGGTKVNPTYREVSGGGTGHAESVQVTYDPKQVSYDQLLHVFWHNIDPLDGRGQFCDKGSQYRSGIFYRDDQQKKLAEASQTELVKTHKFQQPIQTEIVAAGPFYPAEDYHQNYYQTHALKYQFYRRACGRDQRLAELWGQQAGH